MDTERIVAVIEAQSGLAHSKYKSGEFYCAIGALMKSVGCTDDRLEQDPSMWEEESFMDRVQIEFGLDRNQVEKIMTYNDMEPCVTPKERKRLMIGYVRRRLDP